MKDQTIDMKPLRADPAATDVVVRSELVQPRQATGPARLPAERDSDGMEDLRRDRRGVSLVATYRDQFNEQIRAAASTV